jgi:dipeptidyl aminopeptidase/acylaminoacyl peptidase
MRGQWSILVVGIMVYVCVLTRPAQSASLEEQVYVRSFDGAYVAAYLRIPEGPGPHPAIMFIHGGVGGQGKMKKASEGYVQNHMFAEGFAVFQVDYRWAHFGDEELEDMVACYRYLRSRPEIDPARVGVIGGSHGGYLTMMLATRETPAAVVAFAGLNDIVGVFYKQAAELAPTVEGDFDWRERRFHHGKTIREESELIESGELNPRAKLSKGAVRDVTEDMASRWGTDVELYKRYDPKYQYSLIRSPLLYLVGSEDRWRTGGKEIIENLKKLGRTAEYSEHPEMGHGFYWGGRPDKDGNLPMEFYHALKKTTDFMRKWVKQEP